ESTQGPKRSNYFLRRIIMASVNLDAVVRSDFGKGAARQARRDGQIPAVVYGAGSEPQHVLLPARETTLAVRDRGVELVLNIEGKTVKTRSEEHTSELQSRENLVCRLLLEKKKKNRHRRQNR